MRRELETRPEMLPRWRAGSRSGLVCWLRRGAHARYSMHSCMHACRVGVWELATSLVAASHRPGKGFRTIRMRARGSCRRLRPFATPYPSPLASPQQQALVGYRQSVLDSTAQRGWLMVVVMMR